MGDARRVLWVAASEIRRYVRGFDGRALLLIAAAVVLLALLWPHVLARGLHPDADLYRVDTDPRSPLAPVVDFDVRFQNVGDEGQFLRGEAELLISGPEVAYDPRVPLSRSAAHDFSRAAQAYFDHVLEREPDSAAAFPVEVNLVYEPRAAGALAPPRTGEPAPTPGVATSPPAAALVEESDNRQLALQPNQVNPPFPMSGLLLSFAYLIPLNFLSQYYAGTFLEERTRNRGILLLSTPLSGAQIVLAKSLPYVALSVAIAAATTLWIHAGLLAFLAILPVLAFALASTLLFALVARSHRELTFFIVTTTVLLSTFLFLPAVFTEIPSISFLSPITVVVNGLRGEPVTFLQFAHATAPITLAAIVLASLAVVLYREEDLFAPQTVLSRLTTAIHGLAPRTRHLVPAAALAVPFALALEVFVLVFAITLNANAALILFLLGAAFVEEALKALLAYAFYARSLQRHAPWIAGSLIGLGFFVGEKLVLLFQLVGFGLLPRGGPILAVYGIAPSVLLVLLPLLLHAATAAVLAYAARAGKTHLAAALPLATFMHAAYNAAIYHLTTGGVLHAP